MLCSLGKRLICLVPYSCFADLGRARFTLTGNKCFAMVNDYAGKNVGLRLLAGTRAAMCWCQRCVRWATSSLETTSRRRSSSTAARCPACCTCSRPARRRVSRRRPAGPSPTSPPAPRSRSRHAHAAPPPTHARPLFTAAHYYGCIMLHAASALLGIVQPWTSDGGLKCASLIQ